VTLNVVRDRPAARLLPSRRHFALARLIAFLRLRAGADAPLPADHLILSIDRDQTAAEMYGVPAAVSLVLASYIAAALPLPAPIAVVTALPLGVLAVQVAIVLIGIITGLLLRTEYRTNINSATFMTLMLLASSYAATLAGPVRYAAWLWLASMLLNAIAACVLWLLRGAVREAEERCVR
jgi:hypothetical protein